MKRFVRNPFIVVALVFGLALGSISISPVLGGTNNGCLGGPASSATLKLGGRAVVPADLVTIDAACGPSQTGFKLFSYERTVLVSATGTAVQAGTNLQNALAAIPGPRNTTNPWLVKLEPGTYDLGTNPLQMLEYVDIEGSGEDVTIITGAGSSTNTTGTVLGSNNAELRFLTVANKTLTANYSTAIYNSPSITSSMRLTNITASAYISGGTAYSAAIFNDGASPIIRNVTAIASANSQVSNGGSSINTVYGIVNNNGAPQILNSSITVTATAFSNAYGIINNGAGYPVLIQNSVIKASYTPGGQSNPSQYTYGINNGSDTTPSILNSNINVNHDGPGQGYGIYSSATSGLLQNSTVVSRVTNGDTAFGVYEYADPSGAGLQINASNITASGNNTSYAVLAEYGQLNVNNSTMTGTSAALSVAGIGSKINVGASWVNGPAVISYSGTLLCIASYKATYVAASSTCS